MSTRYCPTHPTRPAPQSCRRCSKPICDECVASFGGRFCSRECTAAFEEFQGRVRNEPVGRRTRFSLVGCLRTLVISTVLLVVIWVALWQLFGTTDPGEMLTELHRMLRIIF